MQTRGIPRFQVFVGAIAVVCMIALGGCGKANEEAATSAPVDVSKSASAKGGIAEDLSQTQREAPLHYAARQPGAERSVVRNAALGVDVANLDKAERKMKDSVSAHGGYIDHEEGDQLASETPLLRVTIRVPESSFDEVVTTLEGLGRRTLKTISASDKTEEILAIQASMAKLRDQQAEYFKKTPTSIDPTAPQMKALQQQMDELRGSAAMSTIDLTLQQRPSPGESAAANATWGSDTWNSAISASMGALRVVGGIAIWLLAFSPIWGTILAATWLIFRNRKTSSTIRAN